MPENFFTMEMLATYPGIILAVVMFTQMFKDAIDKVYKFNTRYLAFFFALILINGVSYITTGLSEKVVFLNVVNSVLVSFMAIMSYDELTKKFKKID